MEGRPEVKQFQSPVLTLDTFEDYVTWQSNALTITKGP